MFRKPWIFGLFLFAAACLFLYAVKAVAVPFFLALALAYFLDPAADSLEKRGVSRGMSVVIVFAGFLLAAAALLALIVPAVRKEILIVQAALPRYATSLYNLIPPQLLEAAGIDAREDLQSLFGRALDAARGLSFDVLNRAFAILSRAFTSTLSFLLAVLGYLIIPVYLFYLLRDFGRLREGILDFVPLRYRPEVIETGKEINAVLGGFLRGQVTVCLILAALYSLGLALIGVDLALVVGIVSGLAFIIPYLGTIFGIVAGSLLAAVEFGDFLHPALVVAWFGLVQALEGTLITPKIVGDRVGLGPLTTLLAVLVGGELFGFLGLLFAVPAAASAKVVLRRAIRSYQSSAFFRGEGPYA